MEQGEIDYFTEFLNEKFGPPSTSASGNKQSWFLLQWDNCGADYGFAIHLKDGSFEFWEYTDSGHNPYDQAIFTHLTSRTLQQLLSGFAPTNSEYSH